MEQKELFEKMLEILTPFVKDKATMANVSLETRFIKDLEINSARYVDILLSVEDMFDIEVGDDEAEGVESISDMINVISGHISS